MTTLISLISVLLPLVIIVAVIGWMFKKASQKNLDDSRLSTSIAKVVALVILLELIIGTYAALKSLLIEPSHTKYFYENLATGLGSTAILLIFALSAFQRNVYWITLKRTLKLDERQIKERQQVFETSYKLGALLVFFAAWFFATKSYNIPVIIVNNFNRVPGHLYWPAFNLAITLFALPLVIAAWKKR